LVLVAKYRRKSVIAPAMVKMRKAHGAALVQAFVSKIKTVGSYVRNLVKWYHPIIIECFLKPQKFVGKLHLFGRQGFRIGGAAFGTN
jgi:hypothetical protein